MIFCLAYSVPPLYVPLINSIYVYMWDMSLKGFQVDYYVLSIPKVVLAKRDKALSVRSRMEGQNPSEASIATRLSAT